MVSKLVDTESLEILSPEKGEEYSGPIYIYVLYSAYTLQLWRADADTDVEGTKLNWESIVTQALITKLPDPIISCHFLAALPRVEVLAAPREMMLPKKDGTLVWVDLAAMTAAIIYDLNLKWPDYVKRRSGDARKE